jgi:hypothetical protein
LALKIPAIAGTGQNGAKIRNVRDGPSPRRELEDLEAQGFNPELNPGLYTQFVGGNKASLDSVNEYRLEAYATLLFGALSDRSRSCVKTITADPPRRRDGLK